MPTGAWQQSLLLIPLLLLVVMLLLVLLDLLQVMLLLVVGVQGAAAGEAAAALRPGVLGVLPQAVRKGEAGDGLACDATPCEAEWVIVEGLTAV